MSHSGEDDQVPQKLEKAPAFAAANAEVPIAPVLEPGLGRPEQVAQILSPELNRPTNAGNYGFAGSQHFPFANGNRGNGPNPFENGTGGNGPNPFKTQPPGVPKVEPVPITPAPPRRIEPVPITPAPPRRIEPVPITPPKDAPQVRRPGQEIFTSDRVTRLHRLDNRAADHSGPDAVVHIPKGFDPTKPVNVIIYNHGHGATVDSAYRDARLGQQMANAPPNSILVIPEWQVNAGSSIGAQGRFAENGRFRNMLQEIFNKTPGLQGKKIDDIAEISIVAHSAGYGPTETILNKNGLGHKVKSITMLDATYNPQGLDSWLRANIRELAAGTKQFHNFYNDTAGNSRAQAERVRTMLRQAGLPASAMLEEHGNGSNVLWASRIAEKGIVFKHTTATTDRLGPHGSVPNLYFGPVQAAATIRANRRGR